MPQLTLSKILNELKTNSENPLHLKAQNLFVDPAKIDFYKNQLIELIKTGKVKRIIVDGSKINQKSLNFLNNLSNEVQLIVVVDEKSAIYFDNFNSLSLTHNFDELREESQEKLLNKKIQFQGGIFKLFELFDNLNENISSEILTILCNNDEIIINSKEAKKIENFIVRKIEMKQKSELTNNERGKNLEKKYDLLNLEDFIKIVKNDRIVVISDTAGSGKTFLM